VARAATTTDAFNAVAEPRRRQILDLLRDGGRQRRYRLNGHALEPIHEWVRRYERTWSERFDELDTVLEELKTEEENRDDRIDEK